MEGETSTERTGRRRQRHGPHAQLATVALAVLVLVVGGGAWYVLDRAWRSPGSRGDFWSVAAPGVATGGGTSVRAAVTVWVAQWQRRREDELRRRDRAERDADRAKVEEAAAWREARKVIPSWHDNSGRTETLVVTNAGRETIVEFYLVGATAEPPDPRRNRWSWFPEEFEDSVYLGRTPSWYRPFIAPGSETQFVGMMVNIQASGAVTSVPITVNGFYRFIKIEIAWTDPGGRHWRRRGTDEPVQIAEPYEPPPQTELLDFDDPEEASKRD